MGDRSEVFLSLGGGVGTAAAAVLMPVRRAAERVDALASGADSVIISSGFDVNRTEETRTQMAQQPHLDVVQVGVAGLK